jgi:hypothetical protein
MTRYSLPVQRFDGSVVIQPLCPKPALGEPGGAPRPGRYRPAAARDTRVERAKILRDLAILALLALTIVAGSAVIVSMLWRDVVVADSEARKVEAEQAARVRLAEAELLAAGGDRESRAEAMMVIVLAGFGTAVIALALARPSIIIGR